ncbi:heavy-metal-associated domain-containing protein [Pasteurella multocida]|uniref:heavy-metal-associated domain-containing protein n=1 Tax=Pasteurella multocida TaxID=747 RepID=UPI00061A5237|nr:heavy-metal-associated domain-containing protein [Pasteurella multocida]AKD40835.1 MerP [Pasteurella multocida OH1905]AWB52466.1 copper chaperone [Pasteurella multocida]MCL7786468.1 heavy-metal-associated domain-containing protein [Pasteurella multocida]MCL7796418.1 heavy-metal-associated domain-containing protein [Pasteurella multocida]MCL7802440.1 heavy-metal-associated domain-containing protein [Pasteurella multocida]
MKKILCLPLLFFYLFNISYATTPSLNTDEKHVMIHIKEMTCQLCVYLVNKELRNIEGVISTKANFKDRIVNIVAKKEVDNQHLLQAIKKLEYTPDIIQSQ